MRLAIAGGLAAAVLAASCLAAADPVELLPAPLEGWTVSGPIYGESLIEDRPDDGPVPAKRIVVSRDYSHGAEGIRVSLNTFESKGAALIRYVNEARQRDPEEAQRLAAKGLLPFSYGSRPGVTQAAGSEGMVSGAALLIGAKGILTLEGVHDGSPAPVALEHIRAYLVRTDLDRMEAFVRDTNAQKAE